MYSITPGQLPAAVVELDCYDIALGLNNSLVLVKNSRQIKFDPDLLTESEIAQFTRYKPKFVALIGTRGSDQHATLSTDRGAPKAFLNGQEHIISLVADNYSNGTDSYFAAGIAPI